MLISFLICILVSAVVHAEPEQISNGRIIGGSEVSITDFPWQVSLNNERGHFCGGTIIDRRRILTAAHCVNRNRNPDYPRYVWVRVGSTNRVSGGSLRAVQKIIIHEKYDASISQDHNIAVLVLKYPLLYTKSIQPIELPQNHYRIPVNTTVYISGWGTQTFGIYDPPDNLHAVSVQVVDQNECAKAYNTTYVGNQKVTWNMLCAGVPNAGGADSCQGDHGGPLAVVQSRRKVLHGIVSWGHQCALPDFPGVYTRVSEYIDWINSAK